MSKRRDNPKRAADEYLKDGSLVDYSVYQPKEPPKGLWRRKYPCRKSKGEHAFVLVKPNNWLSERYKHLTVEEYYAQADEARERAREKGHWAGSRWREWRCMHCGKREMDTEDAPSKRIRENLYQE